MSYAGRLFNASTFLLKKERYSFVVPVNRVKQREDTADDSLGFVFNYSSILRISLLSLLSSRGS